MARKRNDAGKFVKSVELPVKLKKQLAGGAVSARVEVTGYEVPKVLVGRVSWWRRWLGLGAPAANTDQWTDLKTRVMDELKTRQGDGGAAQPFVRPLLPEHRPAPEGDWLFRGFVLVSLAAIVVLLMLGGRAGRGPEDAVAKVYEAWRNRDGGALVEVVDVPAVARDVVGQVYGTPALDVTTLPVELRNDVPQDASKAAGMIKEGLADLLEDDVAAAVARGEVGGAEESLLGRMWADMGGEHVQIGKPHVVKEDGKTALVEVLLTRDDSHQLAEVVQLQLEKQEGRWRVVGMPGFATVAARMNYVLTQIAQAEEDMLVIEPAAVHDVVRVGRIEKTFAPDKRSMTLRVDVANTGSAPISGSVLKIVFGDALGVPLRVI